MTRPLLFATTEDVHGTLHTKKDALMPTSRPPMARHIPEESASVPRMTVTQLFNFISKKTYNSSKWMTNCDFTLIFHEMWFFSMVKIKLLNITIIQFSYYCLICIIRIYITTFILYEWLKVFKLIQYSILCFSICKPWVVNEKRYQQRYEFHIMHVYWNSLVNTLRIQLKKIGYFLLMILYDNENLSKKKVLPHLLSHKENFDKA